ncbi:ankyrin repeat domain-containing protein [Gimesia panareensis]|uniref:ankyrin repeat domain-containing protein n=1 Tax=Gimesia panareensis TaxID=2527978 RepID=UPI0018D74C40|nr:ankyrin repeat domain-containing protein [Gimesia panareensis]
MQKPKSGVLEFHQTVRQGTLDDLRQSLKRGVDINAPGRGGETALMVALETKDLEKTKLLLEQGADPELADDLNFTALRHAVLGNFVEGVRLLLDRGVDRGYHPKYPLKVIRYTQEPIDFSKLEMPKELEGQMTREEWQQSLKETLGPEAEESSEQEIEPYLYPVIEDVYNLEILNLFLEAGDNLSQTSSEMKRHLLKLDSPAEFRATPADYQQWKSPRFGTTNPQRMNNPFWDDMIRSGKNAYLAREHFNDNSAFEKPGVVWSFDRFGSSLTRLPDGRYVQVGGEHEDYYDPDFYIYNDVVIHDGQGNFEIYGYPKAVLPPTDFHSENLVKDEIYLIGGLGYPHQRVENETPVYRLKTGTWKIEKVPTTGTKPGWISRHRSYYDPKRNVIRIEGGQHEIRSRNRESKLADNTDSYELNLATLHWQKLD